MAKSDNQYRQKITEADDYSSFTIDQVEKETDKVVESATFDCRKVHQTLRQWVFEYGLRKVLMDRTSQDDIGPGKSAAMQKVYDNLCNGIKEAERERGAPVVSAEIEGVAEALGKPTSAIQTSKRELSAEQWAALIAKPKFAEAIAKVKARREAGASVDLAAELG